MSAPALARKRPSGEKATANSSLVLLERVQELARFRIPETDGAVIAARGQPFAVVREGNAEHPVDVALQRVHPLARLDVPQQDVAVEPGAGKRFAVRSKDYPRHHVLMPFEDMLDAS